MGITNKIGRIAGRGFLRGLLAPVSAVFTTITIVPVILAVSILYGMTTKGPNEQSWALTDYAVVLLVSWVIARNGGFLSGVMP